MTNKPVGRPTKYKKEYAEQLIEYFDKPAFEPLMDSEGNVVVNSAGKPVYDVSKFPSKESFACEIGVHRDTLQEWANVKYPDDYEDEKLAGTHKHPEFSVAYKMAQMYQYRFITQGALSGALNPTFSIFLAKNVLGMRDKVEQEVTVNAHEELLDQLD